MTYEIRDAFPEDELFLYEMLYQALFVPPGDEPFPRSILRDPTIRRYVEGFGTRSGDCGYVATVGPERVGAAWVRLIRGYGFIDERTPELTIAVDPAWRGRGIGTALAERVIGVVPRLSLSSDTRNPAMSLYERLGFETVAAEGTTATMLRRTD